MTRLVAIAACLALTGCSDARIPEVRVVDPGGEVALAPGQMVAVQNPDLELRFVAVTADSRCPRDVTCVWAGEVKVQLEIQQASQPAAQTEIREGESASAGVYTVTLVRVEPQPASTAKIAPTDYRATLKIDKAG